MRSPMIAMHGVAHTDRPAVTVSHARRHGEQPSLVLTFGPLRRSGALQARLVSRARDATGIA